MDRKLVLIATIAMATAGCAPANQSPDAIRQSTANATATAKRDAKAVVQGVYEGLRTSGPVDINTASKAKLETLPGIDGTRADRIIAGRPYREPTDLRRKEILSKAEYDRIATHIKTR